MKQSILLLFIALTSFGISAQGIQNLDDFYSKTGQFLAKYVHDGRVDYKAVAENRPELNTLVDYIAVADLSKENANVKKSFYINTYSILVINAVIKTQTAKVTDDNNFFSGYKYPVAGSAMTLDELEHQLLKDNDPRIHFALVCGAMSCPKLADFAYVPGKLDEQLDARTRLTLNDEAYVSVDKKSKTVKLSSLFDWYSADFKKNARGIIQYINQYRDKKIPEDYKVEFTNYNWDLNSK